MVWRKTGKNTWTLYSKKKSPSTGKRKKLGVAHSKKGRIRRERQVQYFKHHH